LKIFDLKAVGISSRQPSVIVDHEHVHIQHYLDSKNLKGEKLYEIYAYYNYLIYLHISQVRPNNLDEVSYIPPYLNQIETIHEQD
jgi:hypothetical protein